MASVKFGFIGIGNMGGIILDTVLKYAKGEEICVCDSDKSKISRVADSGVTEVDAVTAAGNVKYLFIGVKPQGFAGLFAAVGDLRDPGKPQCPSGIDRLWLRPGDLSGDLRDVCAAYVRQGHHHLFWCAALPGPVHDPLAAV